MLTSLALVFIIGLFFGWIFKQLKLPSLLGMIIAGILLSPYGLDLLDPTIISIAPDLRQIALIIILTRAGLSLDIDDLKKVGRPAFLMCFLPATFEIIAITLIAPKLLNITLIEAALMGSVLAAVSPAVIVPRMIKLTKEGYGRKNSIPQLIMTGGSVDDVFVIVLFTAFSSLALGTNISTLDFIQIPTSIILGIGIGIIIGLLLLELFKRIKMNNNIKVIMMLSISFLLVGLEKYLQDSISIASLLSILTLGIIISRKNSKLGDKIAIKYNELWVGAEVLLFVLVGASLNLNYALGAGLPAIIIVVIGLCFRMVGVYISLIKSPFSKKEKLFSMIAYTPKATVQAAIGAIPLSMGLASGQDILTVAVLSILITAPFGAIGIDLLHDILLDKD